MPLHQCASPQERTAQLHNRLVPGRQPIQQRVLQLYVAVGHALRGLAQVESGLGLSKPVQQRVLQVCVANGHNLRGLLTGLIRVGVREPVPQRVLQLHAAVGHALRGLLKGSSAMLLERISCSTAL